MQKTWVCFLGWEDPLEKGKAVHSSILAWRIPWTIQSMRRRQWHPTPVLLPGKCHGRRSLVGYSPWGREESDTTEWLHFHFSLSCIGEGNGNPLQCSCLGNPRDRGALWAAVSGVSQGRSRLSDLAAADLSTWKLDGLGTGRASPGTVLPIFCLIYKKTLSALLFVLKDVKPFVSK